MSNLISRGQVTISCVENGADSIAIGLRNQLLLVAMTNDGKIVNTETYENQLFLYKGGVAQELTYLNISYYDLSSIVGYSNISAKVTDIAKGLFSVTLTEGYPILNDKALIKLTAKSEDCPDGVSIDFTIQGVRAGNNGEDITVYELLPSSEEDLYFSRNDDDSFVDEYQDIYCGYCKRTGDNVTNYPGNIKANLHNDTETGGTAPYNIFYKIIDSSGSVIKSNWNKNLTTNGDGVLRIKSDTTAKSVIFILADASSISDISDENIIDKEEILIIKAPKVHSILQDVVTKQIDNQISIWFTDYEPTLTNEPASEWTSPALKQEHLEDVCFDRSTGRAYSYSLDEDTDTFSWQEITDLETLKALQNASTAQATADGKANIFLKQPSTPYNIGDVWIPCADDVNGGSVYGSGSSAKKVSVGQILVSTVDRSSDELFNSADWEDRASEYYRDTDFINDVIGNATKGNNVFYFDAGFHLFTSFADGKASGTVVTEYSKGDIAIYVGSTDIVNYTFDGVTYTIPATTIVGNDGTVQKNLNYPKFFCIKSGKYEGEEDLTDHWDDWIVDWSIKSRIDNEKMFQNSLFDKYGHSLIEQTANKIEMVVDDNGDVQSSFKMTANQINLSSTGSITLNDVLKVTDSGVLVNGYLSIEFTDLDESVSNGSNTLYDLSNPTQGVLLKNTFQVKVDNSQYGYKLQDNYRNIKVVLPYDKEYIGTRCIIWNNGGGRVTLPNNDALTGNVYAAEICEIVSQPLQSKVLMRKDEYYEDGVKYNEETYTRDVSAYPIGNVYEESDMAVDTAESWFTSVYFQYGIIELLGVPVYSNVTRYYDYGTDDEKVETAKEIIGTQWIIINRRCAAFGTGIYVSYGDTNYPFRPTQWWENYNEE
jgi:hypothetical protein